MAVNVEALTRAYLNLRTARSQLSAEFERRDKELKEKQARIEEVLLGVLNAAADLSGADGKASIATPAGTVYTEAEIIPTVDDWTSFYDWVKRENAFEALERRVKRTFVAEYMEEHTGAPPPGVTVLRRRVVRIRKAS